MDIVLAKLLPRGIVFLDEAIDSTRLANFFLEQEEPAPVLQRLVQAVPWLVRPYSDEELASPPYQFFFREQEEPQPGWPRTQAIPWTVRPYSDEELAAPPYKFFFLETEDAWIGRVQSLPWLAYSALPLDEDEPTATIAVAVDDEQPACFLVQSTPWLARPFTDEELAAGGLDAETLKDSRYVKAKGIIEGIEQFDAGFFEITPREGGGFTTWMTVRGLSAGGGVEELGRFELA